MLFWIIIKSAFKSLLANKFRSFLAMLGIIIGVGAVIATLAIGAGARASVMERLSILGTDLLVVRPGQSRGSRGVSRGELQNLTVADAEAIVAQSRSVKQVAPSQSGRAQVIYSGRNVNTTIMGTTVTYFPIRNFVAERGRLFTETEMERNVRVAVIGPATAEELFDQEDPLGKTIRIKKTNFTVVGVMKAKGDQGWFNPDDQVIIPIPIAITQIFGRERLREINVQAMAGVQIEQMKAEVEQIMRRQHRIVPPKADDFHIRNMAEIVDTYAEVSKTFSFLLGGIASISLVVGGIGIMNIMLVTVTERTKEIGIRMAVGARRRDILRQFLLESILMSGIGGGFGTIVGAGSAILLGRVTDFQTLLQPTAVLLALCFSASIGIFFGLYPARRAAGLHPVETLRYE